MIGCSSNSSIRSPRPMMAYGGWYTAPWSRDRERTVAGTAIRGRDSSTAGCAARTADRATLVSVPLSSGRTSGVGEGQIASRGDQHGVGRVANLIGGSSRSRDR